MKPNTFCMLLHLSQLLGCTAMPVLGWVAPIVLWVLGKDKNAQIDQHGRIVMNWIISCAIYGFLVGSFLVVSVILCYIIIGFFLLPVALILSLLLWILAIAFPIIGAVKANEGETWKYPLCIPFFR